MCNLSNQNGFLDLTGEWTNATRYNGSMKAKLPEKTLANRIADVLSTYVRTQLILVVVVTAVSWIMLSFMQVDYAWLLAIVTGSASVIPILGILVTAVIAAAVAVFDGARFLPNLPALAEGIVVLVLYGVLNVIIDYFLSPYMIGKSAKIHPMLLLVAVILGTVTFGFLGAIFTVPVLLVIKTVSEHGND